MMALHLNARPSHLNQLMKLQPTEKLAAIRSRLALLETGKLIKALPELHKKKLRIEAYIANQELTSRGMPPCFRELGYMDTWLGEPDCQIIDLEWIVSAHPNVEREAYGFYKNLFNPYAFNKTAEQIWQEGRRPMWKIVSGLALTTTQQLQCSHIATDKIRNRRIKVIKQLPDVINTLRSERYKRGVALLSDKEQAEFQRWIDIWLIADLAQWSPTETARLYELKTGNKLTRPMAGKILTKLDRDAWKYRQ